MFVTAKERITHICSSCFSLRLQFYYWWMVIDSNVTIFWGGVTKLTTKWGSPQQLEVSSSLKLKTCTDGKNTRNNSGALYSNFFLLPSNWGLLARYLMSCTGVQTTSACLLWAVLDIQYDGVHKTSITWASVPSCKKIFKRWRKYIISNLSILRKLSFPKYTLKFERSHINSHISMCQLWKTLLNVTADFDSLPWHLFQDLLSVAAIHSTPLDNAVG